MTRKFDVIGYQDWGPCGHTGTTASRVSVDITEEFGSSSKLIASTRLQDYEDVEELIKDNQVAFSNPDRWRVNQPEPMERTGILNFKSIPFWVFKKHWRKPVNIFESGLTPMGGGIYRFMKPSYFGNCWNRRITGWFNWVEVNILVDGNSTPLSSDNNPIFKFLEEHSPELVLFTDDDTIFLDPQIEFAYLGDFGIRS